MAFECSLLQSRSPGSPSVQGPVKTAAHRDVSLFDCLDFSLLLLSVCSYAMFSFLEFP